MLCNVGIGGCLHAVKFASKYTECYTYAAFTSSSYTIPLAADIERDNTEAILMAYSEVLRTIATGFPALFDVKVNKKYAHQDHNTISQTRNLSDNGMTVFRMNDSMGNNIMR